MNHVHPLDCTMAKVALFPYRLWFISLASNLQKPFTGWLIRFCGGVPLPDDIHGMAALERGMEARIRGGAFVHFYPEGMLVPYHEGLRAFHPGAFTTAVRAGCPVVPMMLCRRPARGLWAWRKKPCFTLRIGAPLYADASLPKKQAARDLQLRAEAAMLALERGETPPLAVGEPALDAE
jgi:1,2-diacylglycerol 3-alpha-glucosyltransferase